MLDASLVTIAFDSRKVAKNLENISFSYHLPPDALVPAGRLTFIFEVLNSTTRVKHTVSTLWYQLPLRSPLPLLTSCSLSRPYQECSGLPDSVLQRE